MAQGHKRRTESVKACEFDSNLRKLNMYCFHFLALVTSNPRRCVSPLDTQCLYNYAGRGERKCMVLGSQPLSYPAVCGIV